MSPRTKPVRKVDIVVVTGMSGSGKSTAINALEDEGYYCIDNLPTALVPRFVELCAAGTSSDMDRVGLGLDLRDVSYAEQWPKVRGTLEMAGHGLFTIFLDARDEILLRRFSETRRLHPLGHGRDLPEAIQAERAALAPLKARASLVLDTSGLTVHELKRRIRDLVAGHASDAGPAITIKSFGFKYGIAGDADIVLDVRFLPNPYFDEKLRPLNGMHETVAHYVLDRQDTTEFLAHVLPLLRFLLPHYTAEGRSYLTVGIGCTGGQHRSVALAEHIGRTLQADGFSVIVRHRDVERG